MTGMKFEMGNMLIAYIPQVLFLAPDSLVPRFCHTSAPCQSDSTTARVCLAVVHTSSDISDTYTDFSEATIKKFVVNITAQARH